MTSKTHIASGILTILVFSYLKDEPNFVLLLSGGILGSIIPDIDSPSSALSKQLPFISKPWSFIRKKSKKHKFKTAGNILEHRGITHTFLFITLLWCFFSIFELLSNPFITGLLLGILSHILTDMLNDKGVPLLVPIYSKRIRIAKITTGKGIEKIFFILVWVTNILIIYVLLKNVYPELFNFQFGGTPL